jgi:predicted PurR-regulated permease PerM
MSLPPPTAQQARILWNSITGLAVAVLIGLLALLVWGAGWVINQLSSVLLPLAVAAIFAYLLDPIVDFFERKRIPRTRAILLVFFIGIMLTLAVLGTVVPQLVVEIGNLINDLPQHFDALHDKIRNWLAKSPGGKRAQEIWDSQFRDSLQAWLADTVAPIASAWLMTQLSKLVSWFGLVIGLLLVPVYLFYFLLEKQGIKRSWTDYLPLRESRWKEEAVFVVRSVNESLIVFFRSQVLVALCVGILTTLGFLAIRLEYAVVLGVITGVFGIIPYLGVMVSFIPAVTLGIIQFGDWRVLLVVMVFVAVQMLEGLVLSPKIIGDRVGLHPLTVMIAIMVGTTLMGGILGGLLAIPFTAVLRTLMFRYVWKRRTAAPAT